MNKKDIKILLVDDEPDILEIVGYNLSNEGYQVITAENGLEGVKKAKKERPHLIILDVMMPEMDGLELVGHIRSRGREKPYVYIILLTSRGDKEDVVKGLTEAGVDDYVVKPFSPRELVARIKVALRRNSPAKASEGQRAAIWHFDNWQLRRYLPNGKGAKHHLSL